MVAGRRLRRWRCLQAASSHHLCGPHRSSPSTQQSLNHVYQLWLSRKVKPPIGHQLCHGSVYRIKGKEGTHRKHRNEGITDKEHCHWHTGSFLPLQWGGEASHDVPSSSCLSFYWPSPSYSETHSCMPFYLDPFVQSLLRRPRLTSLTRSHTYFSAMTMTILWTGQGKKSRCYLGWRGMTNGSSFFPFIHENQFKISRYENKTNEHLEKQSGVKTIELWLQYEQKGVNQLSSGSICMLFFCLSRHLFSFLDMEKTKILSHICNFTDFGTRFSPIMCCVCHFHSLTRFVLVGWAQGMMGQW